MAAHDEFPRGWTLNNIVLGAAGTPSITVPGVAGIVHVLDSLFARITSFSAAAAFEPILAITTIPGVVLQTALLTQGGASIADKDSVSMSGLNLSSGAGGSIVVAFNTPGVANVVSEITIQGHDI